MKTTAKKLLVGLGILSLFVLIGLPIQNALAVPKSSEWYTPLEALPNKQGVISNQAFQVNDFFTTLYYFSLTAAVFLAVIMIIYGGVQYMARGVSESMAKGAKERIFNALKGLLLALLSYLILYTINPDLTTPRIFVPRIEGDAVNNPVPGGTSGDNPVPGSHGAVPGDVYGNYVPPKPAQEVFTDIKASEAATRTQLANAGIKINHPEDTDGCDSYGQPSCTTVGGLPSDAISRLQKLRADCPSCALVVTGGTEWWNHLYNGTTEHGPGRPVIDMSPTGSLTTYLTQNGTRVGAAYVVPGIGTFVGESNHYHVYLNQ